jgi:hypothetical protein
LLSFAFRDVTIDKAWDYPPYTIMKDTIWMKRLTEDLYKCVILPGLANCAISNWDDPPGSFHTGDVFVSHETLPN